MPSLRRRYLAAGHDHSRDAWWLKAPTFSVGEPVCFRDSLLTLRTGDVVRWVGVVEQRSGYRQPSMRTPWKQLTQMVERASSDARSAVAPLVIAVLMGTVSGQPSGEEWFALIATGSASEVRGAIEVGADALELDADGWSTVAVAAAMNPDPDVTTILVAAGADPTARVGNFDLTPLMVAALSTPNREVVRALLAAGSDFHACDTRGFSALHHVVHWDPYRHARPYLVDRHTVDAIAVDGDRITLSAPFTSQPDPFEATFHLPNFGFDVSARVVELEGGGATLRIVRPLPEGVQLEGIVLVTPRVAWRAVSAGTSSTSLVQLLIEAGADPNMRNGFGDTVLATAASFGAPDAVLRLLLDAGADVHSRSERGSTALMSAAAARTATPETLRILIEAGADVNARSEHGWSALMYAATEATDHEMLRVLIDAGADVNARGGFDNRTILMHAATLNSNPDVLTVLLEAGADPTVVDQTGRRAIDYARTNDHLRGTDAYWHLIDASFD